ncbi:hypothetical protein ACVILK_002999 [Bradyrhizobium embrapense]
MPQKSRGTTGAHRLRHGWQRTASCPSRRNFEADQCAWLIPWSGCIYEPASSVFGAVAQASRATNWVFARQANWRRCDGRARPAPPGVRRIRFHGRQEAGNRVRAVPPVVRFRIRSDFQSLECGFPGWLRADAEPKIPAGRHGAPDARRAGQEAAHVRQTASSQGDREEGRRSSKQPRNLAERTLTTRIE